MWWGGLSSKKGGLEKGLNTQLSEMCSHKRETNSISVLQRIERLTELKAAVPVLDGNALSADLFTPCRQAGDRRRPRYDLQDHQAISRPDCPSWTCHTGVDFI